jgi:hypothetical protein
MVTRIRCDPARSAPWVPRRCAALGRRSVPPVARTPDDDHPDDRALDRLADRGPSRVGVEGALRARDVSRPTPADVARAQRTTKPR